MSRAYLLLILFGLLVIVGAAGYRQGHQAATTAAEAEQAKHLRNAIRQADEIAAKDREIITAGDARVARVDTVFRTLDREVIRYVKTHPLATDCLDADGLRLWAGLNAGDADALAAGDGADTASLPGAPAASDRGDRPGPAGGPRPAGEAVSPTARGGRDVGRLDAGNPPHWGWQ